MSGLADSVFPWRTTTSQPPAPSPRKSPRAATAPPPIRISEPAAMRGTRQSGAAVLRGSRGCANNVRNWAGIQARRAGPGPAARRAVLARLDIPTPTNGLSWRRPIAADQAKICARFPRYRSIIASRRRRTRARSRAASIAPGLAPLAAISTRACFSCSSAGRIPDRVLLLQAQAVPPRRHPIREDRNQLPRRRHHRRNRPMDTVSVHRS